MNANHIWLVLLVVVALVGFPRASGAQVPYLSGGVGADERQELADKEKDYNLKIITAETSGDYLGDVRVVIESAGKARVLEATMDGPILLAKLSPGTYTIKATLDNKTLTKSVTISAGGLLQVDLRWNPPRR